MGLTLVDASVWIEYGRATGSPAHLDLKRRLVGHGHQLAVTEPVLMEVLAGTRTARDTTRTRRLLRSQNWLPIDPVADFDGAAALFRDCRRRGVTPRGLMDCLIAAIAIRNDAEVLGHDRDLRMIAAVSDLRIADLR